MLDKNLALAFLRMVLRTNWDGAPATSVPGLGCRPCHICTGTGLSPRPHLHRDWAGSAHGGSRTGASRWPWLPRREPFGAAVREAAVSKMQQCNIQRAVSCNAQPAAYDMRHALYLRVAGTMRRTPWLPAGKSAEESGQGRGRALVQGGDRPSTGLARARQQSRLAVSA